MGIYDDIQRAFEGFMDAPWPPEPSPMLATQIEIGDVSTLKSKFPVVDVNGPATLFASIPVYTNEKLAPNEYVVRNSDGQVLKRGWLKVGPA